MEHEQLDRKQRIEAGLAFISETILSQAEFAAWTARHPADDPNRYELLSGRVIMNPPSSWPEGEGEGDVLARVRTHVRAGALGRVFGPSQGYELPTGDTVAPDVSYISQARWEAGPRPMQGEFLRIVPDLAIEVISPTTERRDRVEKRILYAQSGVREYWLVDLRRREITVHVREGEGQFGPGRVYRDRDPLVSQVLPGLTAQVADFLVAP